MAGDTSLSEKFRLLPEMPRTIISIGFQAYYIVNRFLTSLRDKYRTNYFCNLPSLSC